MLPISLQLSTFGQGTVPGKWVLAQPIEMQRLYYVLGGRGSYQLPNGCSVPFCEGCFYLFPYHFPARFFSDPAEPLDHVYFDFVSMPPVLADSPLHHPSKSPALQALATLLKETTKGHNRTDFDCGYALLNLTLTLLQREMEIPFRTDPIISEALTLIWTQYGQPLSVSEMAASVHLEQNYFIRRFKTLMGQTPYAYLRSYRIARAKELLHAGATLAQAAEQTGFQTAASLSRALHSVKQNRLKQNLSYKGIAK